MLYGFYGDMSYKNWWKFHLSSFWSSVVMHVDTVKITYFRKIIDTFGPFILKKIWLQTIYIQIYMYSKKKKNTSS